jgi:hypothetical protein
MRHLQAVQAALVAATMALAGCGSQAQDQGSVRDKAATPDYRDKTKSPPPKPLSADAEAPTGEKESDKDKRGNTPPGKDRSGGGPASGAIVDPSGVIGK